MAFKNPSVVSGISKKEFEDLKQRVDNLENEIMNLKVNQNQKDMPLILEKNNISNAKLNGVPRIIYLNQEYFKQRDNEVEKELENINIDTNSVNEPDEKIEDMPFEKVISIDEVLKESEPFIEITDEKIPSVGIVETGKQRTLNIPNQDNKIA